MTTGSVGASPAPDSARSCRYESRADVDTAAMCEAFMCRSHQRPSLRQGTQMTVLWTVRTRGTEAARPLNGIAAIAAYADSGISV